MTDLRSRELAGSSWNWPRFAAAKFRPPVLPVTMVARPALEDRLAAGAPRLLTLVVGPAGPGKTVLLASWAAARSPVPTAWLSCDAADAQPVRFWCGFIQAVRAIAPDFGTDAGELLGMGEDLSPDVTASLANDAERLPAGAAIIVRDFHCTGQALSPSMADLIARWPASAAQLVLAGRFDPVLRLHRLRMSGELCELRERDLAFSVTESRDLLANFGVAVDDDDLAKLHERTEGWAAALQMAALALRATTDPPGRGPRTRLAKPRGCRLLRIRGPRPASQRAGSVHAGHFRAGRADAGCLRSGVRAARRQRPAARSPCGGPVPGESR